jgi:hypothetical protein
MMEAVNASEMSFSIYQDSRCSIPEDSHLHTRCRENVKSHENKDIWLSESISRLALKSGSPTYDFFFSQVDVFAVKSEFIGYYTHQNTKRKF